VEWNLSPEQDAHQEAFRGWLSDVAPPDAVRRWLDAGDAAAFEKLFGDGGWGGVGLPEELGNWPGWRPRPPGGWRPCSPCPRWPWPGTVT
jgi:alkylation response protein AidB-like acyl-CoA dehydrogenase